MPGSPTEREALRKVPGEKEPSPPDILEIVVQNDGAADGNLTFEAVIKPCVESTAELTIDDPGGAKLQDGQNIRRLTFRKGDKQIRERVQVNVAGAKARSVKVRLRLLGKDDKPWLIVEREVKVNQPKEESGLRTRVPVVHTLPDGTQVVEYLTSQEALARGLPAGGKPAASPTVAPADGTEEK